MDIDNDKREKISIAFEKVNEALAISILLEENEELHKNDDIQLTIICLLHKILSEAKESLFIISET